MPPFVLQFIQRSYSAYFLVTLLSQAVGADMHSSNSSSIGKDFARSIINLYGIRSTVHASERRIVQILLGEEVI